MKFALLEGVTLPARKVPLQVWPFEADAWAFHQLSSNPSGNPDVLNEGLVLWLAQVGDDAVGLEWGWSKLKAGAVVMSDATRFESNAQLVDQAGEPIAARQRLICLARTVWGLPWTRACNG